eukprot:TRINITY_DN20811_c0_g1_i2.p1 TRINITY_DN20811_c0_g1~~TRINITY_DN20811_c0_g1_i2.p1  ORF type:complete len:533 (-),score=118.27 TRINITY_DN20811_c0_g1_i2:98-1696(-)
MLVQHASPAVSKAVGLMDRPPWITGPVDWEVLDSSRAFAMVIFAAEHEKGGTTAPPMVQAKSSALRDALFHGVSRRMAAMCKRVLAVMPPLTGRASAADVLLLEKVVRLASSDTGDPEWLAIAEAQFKRGERANAWQSGSRVVKALADLSAQGEERAHQLMLEVAAPEHGISVDEPRDLFPERASECAICFEPLYENSPAFFLDAEGQRTCVHYVCGGCADTVVATKECPICRRTAVTIRSLPNVEVDPRGWFAAASRNNGRLDTAELCHAIAACLPVSEERLLNAIEKEDWPWKRGWHRAGDCTITEEDFFAPDRGLFGWILAHLRELHHNDSRPRNKAPDLRAQPVAWFDFWDANGTGVLSFGEVLRGVFVSKKLSALEDRQQLHTQREEAKRLWRQAGLKSDSVSREEFLRPGGLATLLSAAFQDADVPLGSVVIAALPKPERKRTDSSASSVTPTSGSAGPTTATPSAPSSAVSPPSPPTVDRTFGLPPHQQEALDTLEAMGFERQQAAIALQQANGNPDVAVGMLLG